MSVLDVISSATSAVTLPPDSFVVLSLAATWVLVALGLHLTFGLLGVVNLAHGEFLLVGAYAAFAVHALTGSVTLGVLIAPPVAALLGALLDVAVLRRLRGRLLDTLLATFGAAVVLRQGVQVIAGPNPRTLPDPIGQSLVAAGMVVPGWRLLTLVITIVAVVALGLLIGATRTGVRWRAAAGDARLATTMGLDVDRMRTAMFAVGSGLAGLAGALLAPLSTLSPQYGTRFLVPAFLVAILGGAGSLVGLVLAGVVLGATLGVLQFFVDAVSAQMLVVLLAVVLLRVREPVLARLGGRSRRARAGGAH